jgi:predicted Zn-dependent peptidase
MNTCFPNLPYHRPILGPTEVIEKLTCQQMRDFHRQSYQPSAMTVAVAGNLPVASLTEIIANQFTNSQFHPLADNLNLLPELPFTEIVAQEYTDPSLQQARLIMFWRVPGLNNLLETLALDVLAVILGQGKLSRLFRDLRETRHLVTKISSTNMTYKVQGVFYISAQLPVTKLAEVETAIIEHLQQVQQEGITATELNRVCLQVANHFIFQSEKPSNRTNLYGYYHSQLQDLNPALKYAENVRNLTIEDIQQAAQKYLSTQAYGIVKAKNC